MENKEYVKGEIVYTIETLVNDEILDEKEKEKLYNLNDEDIDNIADKILDNDWLWSEINFLINDAIEQELNGVMCNV